MHDPAAGQSRAPGRGEGVDAALLGVADVDGLRVVALHEGHEPHHQVRHVSSSTHNTGMFQKKTQGSACIKNLLRYIEDDKTALIIFHNPLVEVGFRFEISFLFHCQLLA